MSAAIAGTPSIALSWGLMTGYKPPTQDLIEGAIKISCQVISKLWDLGFPEPSLLYTVNVPVSSTPRSNSVPPTPIPLNLPELTQSSRPVQLLPTLTQAGGPEVRWTTMARTAYGRLFKAIDRPETDKGGPAAIPESTGEPAAPQPTTQDGPAQLEAVHQSIPLRFAFAPDIRALVDPSPASLVSRCATRPDPPAWSGPQTGRNTAVLTRVPSPSLPLQLPGTDTHALHDGAISVAYVRS